MDIHPLIVHFPVALLTVYAVFECVRVRRLNREPAWLYVKAALLMCGTLGAFVALATGDAAQELSRPPHALVEMHETFATATTLIFAILAGAYLIRIVRSWFGVRIDLMAFRPVFQFFDRISAIILSPIIVVPLALLGLGTLMITGALGGTMVYGPNADPFVSWVNAVLFP